MISTVAKKVYKLVYWSLAYFKHFHHYWLQGSYRDLPKNGMEWHQIRYTVVQYMEVHGHSFYYCCTQRSVSLSVVQLELGPGFNPQQINLQFFLTPSLRLDEYTYICA